MYLFKSEKGKVTYNDLMENVEISLPESDFMDLIQINEPTEIKWPQNYIDSLKNPIGSEPLNVIARGAKKVVIIVSDSSRGIPNAKILPLIINELKAAQIKEEQITVVVAIGVHRPATEDEMNGILGKDYAGKLKIINHDPFDGNKLVYIGKTSYGTPVEVNKTVYEADLRIAVGKVEPHEFAGFSGGRKSVLPGISSEKTIIVNHRPEMILHEKASTGIIEGNPISEDMLESARMLGIHFIVNVVLNTGGEPVGIFSGDLNEAHYRAIEFTRLFCEITLQEKPDIIVTTPGYPLNIDFYQSIKPLIALSSIMKEDGVITLYSACPDGFGSEDMPIPYEGTSSIEEVIQNLMKNYKIQMDHALLLCKIMQKKIKIVAYSPNIKPEMFEKIYIHPAASPQDALRKAYDISGKSNPKVLFFPQPQRTLPVMGLSALCSVLSKITK